MRSIVLFFIMYIALLPSSLGADDAPVSVKEIPASFVFDGKVSPGEWDNVTPLDLIVQTPVYRGEPSERTVIRLAHDENYIYLSGALYDSEPSKVGNNNKLRDGGDESTDWFGMVIDGYNDKQNSLGFFTTPSGSRFDAAVGNDGQGRDPMNTSWNNFWDVKVSSSEEGWFVEMRVPFRSLQYQLKDGKVTMGITAWRYIARKNEMHLSPDIPPDQGEIGVWRASWAKEYTFENVKQSKPFYITPYVLGGYSKFNNLNDTETSYIGTDDVIKDIGLDVKLGLSNNFTMDLTVNTDFAQVEADDVQVNLSRFSLFFPEKRLFFQERSGIFSFRFGGRNNLFYSRRIGIDNDGNSIPIIGGARVTGRAGDWDVGVISMQTQKTDDFLSNNYSVVRLKKRVINENSDLGMLLTYNADTDGSYNAVAGFDSNIRLWRDKQISIKYAQNVDSEINNRFLVGDQALMWVSISKLSQRGLVYAASLSRLGEDFNSGVGFIERTNYTRQGTRLGYNWYPNKDSKLFRHGPASGGAMFWNNADNSFNSSFHRLGYNFNWKNGSRLELGSRIQFDDITETFEVAGIATVPVDKYFYTSYGIEYGLPTGKTFSASAEVRAGDFFDGKIRTISFDPVYNVSPSISLSGTYQYNDISFDSRGEAFDTHVARIKALLMFSTKLSISSFIQYNSLNKLYLGNIRLRFNPKEGNDLFIVYNTDINADRTFENPILPAFNQQSLLIKYSYTFSL